MLERRWSPLREGRFSSEELSEFLMAAACWAPEGSTTSVVGRLLIAEQQREPVRFRCQDWLLIPKTTRIDRLLPLEIPRPFAIESLARELIEQCPSLALPGIEPAARADFERSTAAGFLCLLHGRSLELDHRLQMEMRVECPASASGRARRMELTLMGYLPFGGRVVVATSRLPVDESMTMPASHVEHTDRLMSCWTGDRLRVDEAP